MIKYVNNLDIKNETKIIFRGISKKQHDTEFQTILDELSKRKEIYQYLETTTFYPLTGYNCPKIIFVGLGDYNEYNLKETYDLFAEIEFDIEGDSIIDLDSFRTINNNLDFLAEKVAEIIGLHLYRYEGYKAEKSLKNYNVEIYSSTDVSAAIHSGYTYALATNHARNLVNEPRNKLTPSVLAKYALDLSERLNLDCKIYNKTEIEELGMGAFLCVNQGSKEEAKLIHIKYRNSNSDEITTLIGKGLTYDSGGYSIKSKDGMVKMKTDMGGAASVLGAIEIIATLKYHVNVDVVIAATENLVSNEAIVPDDIIVSMSGKTIEILNTDAEGRLTLVDAVTFAKKNNATRIIDVATLTGGVITALGTNITGVFTNDKDFLNEVKDASEKAGEDIWELPVEQFRDACHKSLVADYNNSPGRDGHASYAAAMIAEFAGDTPWVHLDIAGTCYKERGHDYGTVGATGVMVRTLANLFNK